METTEDLRLDRKDLKIIALKDTISEREDKIADLRVDLTIHAQEIERLRHENQELYSKVVELTPAEEEPVVEGEVVSEED